MDFPNYDEESSIISIESSIVSIESSIDPSLEDVNIERCYFGKVISIFICQLLFAFAFVAVTYLHDPARLYVQSNPGLSIIASIITLSILIVLVCNKNLRRKIPYNFIILFIVTLAVSFLLAKSVSYYYPNHVLLALSLATLICMAFTMYALHTEKDFTITDGYLMICITVLVFTSIVSLFIPETIMTLILTCVGAIIYYFYLMHEIQSLVDRDNGNVISPDDYALIIKAINRDLAYNVFYYFVYIIYETNL